MKSLLKILTLSLAIIINTTACGKVSGSLGGKKSRSVISLLEKGAGSEIVSSSDQSQTLTIGGYKVQSSAGSTVSGLKTTTAGGYKVQMTVQGIIAE